MKPAKIKSAKEWADTIFDHEAYKWGWDTLVFEKKIKFEKIIAAVQRDVLENYLPTAQQHDNLKLFNISTIHDTETNLYKTVFYFKNLQNVEIAFHLICHVNISANDLITLLKTFIYKINATPYEQHDSRK